MLYRFHLGRSRKGRLAAACVPVYYMPYWRPVGEGPDRVDFRPSERTLVHLLGISGLAFLVLALVTWQAGFPWSVKKEAATRANSQSKDLQSAELDRLRDRLIEELPPAEVARIAARQTERERVLQQEMQRHRRLSRVFSAIGRVVHWVAFCGLAAVCVLPIAEFPLARVSIERDGDGALVIRKGGLWPKTRRFAAGTFGQITYGAEEQRGRYRHHRYSLGWRWIVKLSPSAEVAVQHGPSLVDDPEVHFYVDHQKDRPDESARPPERVRQFIGHLRRIAGIDAIGRTVEGSAKQRSPRRRVTRTVVQTEPVVHREEYDSLDDVPEHLRSRVEQMLAEGGEGVHLVDESLRVTVRDAQGNERTYTSLDEMPADVRARYESMLGRARRRLR